MTSTSFIQPASATDEVTESATGEEAAQEEPKKGRRAAGPDDAKSKQMLKDRAAKIYK